MQSINAVSLTKNVLVGAGIALAAIIFFLLQVKHPNPEWGQFWMVRPMIIVPLAGATGGACFYFLNNAFSEKGWRKTLAFIVSVIVYVVGFWMGFVLGLAGTLWN
ncbi:potassium transporter KefB [Emticicia sp. CRIBPO]|uniref:potassium transporter KefB n=1 Tax=Emticicia sp. CRIBPO TaxID=2683258 RepID=UPI001E2D7247|nr:potassium transporter KefB [Emticicia sp. CRIBPO]